MAGRICKTEYQNILKEQNKSVIIQFLEWLIVESEYSIQDEFELNQTKLMNCFKYFLKENNINNYEINALKIFETFLGNKLISHRNSIIL